MRAPGCCVFARELIVACVVYHQLVVYLLLELLQFLFDLLVHVPLVAEEVLRVVLVLFVWVVHVLPVVPDVVDRCLNEAIASTILAESSIVLCL